jgi:hypothetical protein
MAAASDGEGEEEEQVAGGAGAEEAGGVAEEEGGASKSPRVESQFGEQGALARSLSTGSASLFCVDGVHIFDPKACR